MTPFETCVERLTRGERHRVWSLIVTVFGDLAQGSDDKISMQAMARITDPIGVKPEALRVALHRLRKDGWIDSRRHGRSSLFHLTDFGREQSVAAASRIYRAGPPTGSEWSLVMATPSSASSQRELEEIAMSRESVALSANSILTEGGPTNNGGHLFWSRPDWPSVPDWVKAATIGADIMKQYAALLATFREISGALPAGLDPFETATLRTLIVHSWRRILLRHPDVPDALLPHDCKLPDCRSQFSDLLDRIPRERTEKIKAA